MNKAVRHAALYPSWWSYRRNSAAEGGGPATRLPAGAGKAVLYVAGQPFVSATGVDVGSAVALGMTLLAKHVTPHVTVEGDLRLPQAVTQQEDFIPMFSEQRMTSRHKTTQSSAQEPSGGATRSFNNMSVGFPPQLAKPQQQMKPQQQAPVSISNRIQSLIHAQLHAIRFLCEGKGCVEPLSSLPFAVSRFLCGEPVLVMYIVSNMTSMATLASVLPAPRYLFHIRNVPRPNPFHVVVVADDVSHDMWPKVIKSCCTGGLILVQSRAYRDQMLSAHLTD
jgi:hypothetical protein